MKTNGTAFNFRLFTCECGWFRDVSETADSLYTDHPIYGFKSWSTIADLEVKDHDCLEYEISRRVAKGTIRHGSRA